MGCTFWPVSRDFLFLVYQRQDFGDVLGGHHIRGADGDRCAFRLRHRERQVIQTMEASMRRHNGGPMTLSTAAALMVTAMFLYSAWLTSIVFTATNGPHPLLIAAATFPPVGIVHGVGVWFGGW
jgi:hypothetical protein